MLKRYAVHFALIVLFAFTQIGLAAHEINHANEPSQHSQQDKKTAAEPCAQCLSYAQVAGAIVPDGLFLAHFDASFSQNASQYFNTQSNSLRAYAARAPPQNISV
jgi:hypothetical protein